MLERIHIENYKCLRDVTVKLGDFTILVGPNDSGKSSFLEVIQSIGKINRHGYAGIFSGDRTPANLVWRKDTRLNITFEVVGTTAGHRLDYRLEIPIDQRPCRESLEWDGKKLFWTEETSANPPPVGHNLAPGTLTIAVATSQGTQLQLAQAGSLYLPLFTQHDQSLSRPVAEGLASSLAYQFDLDQLPKASVPQPNVALEASGANLAAVLDIMQNSADRSAFQSLQKALHEAIPTLRGIVLPPSPQQPGAKALEFILSGSEQPPVTIPGALASGGALLFTAFLALAYGRTPDLLLFEEPENGLHPFRLQMVVDTLRKMTLGQVGNRKRQIVITTHNPLLLNYATPEEVRVFVRHPEEGTKVIPMKEVPDIDRLLKEFALGELWYLLGEEKLFEEQPA